MLRQLAFAFCLLVSACASGRTVSPPNMKAFELSLATSDAGMMVAWHGGLSGHDAVYIQAVDGAGRSLGEPHRITDASRYAYEPDLQHIGGDALLAWYEKDPATGELTAWLSRVDRNGQSIWRRQLDARGGYARNPVVRMSGENIMVAWIETAKGEAPAVWAVYFNADGSPQAQPRHVGAASPNTWNLNAITDKAGTFYVTYDARLGTQENELRLLAIGSDFVRDVAISPDDSFASVYPDVGISDDGVAALTWFDAKDGNEEVYLAIIPIEDLLAGAHIPARRITHTPEPSIGAYIVWNNDRLALVWCDAIEGQQDLYFQEFVKGAPEKPVQRLTRTATQSSIPSVRAYGNGFAVAWNEYQTVGEGAHRAILTSEARVAQLP